MNKEYKGLLIYEEHDGEGWECRCVAEASEHVKFYSNWESADKYSFDAGCAAVADEIDKFIETIMLPSVNPYSNRYKACFSYKGLNITRCMMSEADIIEWINKKCDQDVLIYVSHNWEWVNYYANRQQEDHDVTVRNARDKIVEVRIYGEWCNNEDLAFYVCYDRNDDYIRVFVTGEDKQVLADEVAKTFGFYESKEIARKILSA